MASPGGTSSGSSLMQQNSSSEEEMQVQIIDERKRKRMQSNRESARRSRMRKQQHLDGLMAQIVNFKKVNEQMLTNINRTTQQFLEIESENSILRAQMEELAQRLQSLTEINNVLGANNKNNQSLGILGQEFMTIGQQGHYGDDFNGFFMNPWNYSNSTNQPQPQPIMAYSDMFRHAHDLT